MPVIIGRHRNITVNKIFITLGVLFNGYLLKDFVYKFLGSRNNNYFLLINRETTSQYCKWKYIDVETRVILGKQGIGIPESGIIAGWASRGQAVR